MTQNDVIIQTVRLRPEGADVTERALDKVRAELMGINTDLRAINAVGGSTVLPFQQMANSAQGAVLPFQEIADDTERAARASEQLKNNVNSAKGGKINLAGVQSVVGQAGGLLSTVGLGSAGSAVASALALTTSLGPLGLALAAGTVAVNLITEAENKRAEAAKRGADAIAQIVDAGVTGQTSKSIQEQIDNEEQRVDGLQDVQDDLLQIQREYAQNIQDTFSGVVDPALIAARAEVLKGQLRDLTGGAVDSLELLDELLEGSRGQIDAANVKIGLYNAQQGTSAVKANDAAAAAEHFTHAAQGVRTVFEDITQGVGDFFIKALEISDQRVSDQTDRYLDALTKEIEIRDEITKTIEKMNEVIAERDAQINEIVAEGEERRSDFVRDAAERRADIERDAQERMQDIAREGASRIAKILRDAGREQFAAVAERDAMAFFQSQIKAKDQLADEKESQQKQIDQLVRNLRKQEEQLDRSLQKQLDTQAKAQQKQIDQIMRSSQKQIDIQQHALDQLNVDLQNAWFAQQAIAMTGAGQQRVIHTQLWTDINSTAVNWASNTVNTLRSIFNSWTGGGSGNNGSGGGAIPGMAGQATFNKMFDARFNTTLRAARGY